MEFKFMYFMLIAISVAGIFVAGKEDKDDDDKKEDNKKEKKAYPKRGVGISGEYVLETDPDNEKLINYMEAMGFDEKTQTEIRETKRVLVHIKKLNKTHWEFRRITKKKTTKLRFQSGEEFLAKLPDGREKPNVISIDENERKAHRLIKMKGFESTHELKFSKEGFNITLKAKEAKARLEFSRWTHPGNKEAVQDALKAFEEYYFGNYDPQSKN